MTRHVALLRGVSPTNASSAQLAAAFERAGFDEVRTVQSSGNVLFTSAATGEAELVRRAEAALAQTCDRAFPTIVRTVDALRALIAADPWADLEVPDGAKRVVTFLRAPAPVVPALPVDEDGATIHALAGREAFTTYVTTPKGPVFMRLIERTLGKDVTTRTWDTVRRLAR